MTLPRFATRAALALCLLTDLSGRAPAAASELDGDWPGWIYFETEGDLPLRLQFSSSDGGVIAHLDAVVQKSFDLPVRTVLWDPPHLVLERTSSSGAVMRFDGTVEGNAYRGDVVFGEAPGTFEFLRSALPIEDTDLAEAEDVVGHYRFPDGEPIVVTSRPWGELIVRAWTTGEPRTLFPLVDGTFFAGRALYAADTVLARVRVVHNAERQVTHLEWTPEGGDAQMAKRIEISSEEVWFVADGDTLRGTVQHTAEAEARPGVVILGGSSWETREDVRFRADMLTVMGFVTLSYDQRGYGLSGGKE
ncbi:MAG: hypothetical protein ACREKH_19305, partial [Candidatus Rokuibacteriota bacterium]